MHVYGSRPRAFYSSDGWLFDSDVMLPPGDENVILTLWSEGFCPVCEAPLAGDCLNWCPRCRAFWHPARTEADMKPAEPAWHAEIVLRTQDGNDCKGAGECPALPN